MTTDEIIALAERHFEATGPSFRFEIFRLGVSHDDGWWTIPVVATHRTGVFLPREFVIGAFANVEVAIHDATGENVLFIPFIPNATEREPQAVTS